MAVIVILDLNDDCLVPFPNILYNGHHHLHHDKHTFDDNTLPSACHQLRLHHRLLCCSGPLCYQQSKHGHFSRSTSVLTWWTFSRTSARCLWPTRSYKRSPTPCWQGEEISFLEFLPFLRCWHLCNPVIKPHNDNLDDDRSQGGKNFDPPHHVDHPHHADHHNHIDHPHRVDHHHHHPQGVSHPNQEVSQGAQNLSHLLMFDVFVSIVNVSIRCYMPFSQLGMFLSLLLCLATAAWVAHYTSADLRFFSPLSSSSPLKAPTLPSS